MIRAALAALLVLLAPASAGAVADAGAHPVPRSALPSAAPAPAHASFYFTAMEYPDGSYAYDEDALVRQSTIPSPVVEVVIDRRRCPKPTTADLQSFSCADRHRRRWWVWLDPATPVELRPRILYHELFHVTDKASYWTLNRLRARLRAINGWRGSWWDARWPSSFGGDMLASPSERAADAAAWCGTTPRSQWRSFDPAAQMPRWPSYLWQPTRAQFVATCGALLRGLP